MSQRKSNWEIPPDALIHWAFLVVILIGIAASTLLPLLSRLKTANLEALFSVALGAGGVGVLLLFLAQFPLYRQRQFLTLGSRYLDRRHRRLYWLAYLFTSVSLLLLCIVWLRTK